MHIFLWKINTFRVIATLKLYGHHVVYKIIFSSTGDAVKKAISKEPWSRLIDIMDTTLITGIMNVIEWVRWPTEFINYFKETRKLKSSFHQICT